MKMLRVVLTTLVVGLRLSTGVSLARSYSIVSPRDGGEYTEYAALRIEAVPSDDLLGGIMDVIFSLDGRQFGPEQFDPPFLSEPFVPTVGLHTAGVYDVYNNIVTMSVFQVISCAPDVDIIAPVNNSHTPAGYPLHVEVLASDPDNIDFVDLYLDGNWIGRTHTCVAGSSECQTGHVFTAYGEIGIGTHELTAVAVDGDGNAAQSRPVTVVANPGVGLPPVADGYLARGSSPYDGVSFKVFTHDELIDCSGLPGNWSFSNNGVMEFDLTGRVPGPRKLQVTYDRSSPVSPFSHSMTGTLWTKQGDGDVSLSDYYKVNDAGSVVGGRNTNLVESGVILFPSLRDAIGRVVDSGPELSRIIDQAIYNGWSHLTVVMEADEPGYLTFGALEHPVFSPPLLLPVGDFSDAPPFQVDSGITSWAVEAEHYHVRADHSGGTWHRFSRVDASGGEAMRATGGGLCGLAPARMDYFAEIAGPGSYRLWVRGLCEGTASGQVKVAFSDSAAPGMSRVITVGETLDWYTTAVGDAPFVVTTSDLYRLSVSLLEHGVVLDKIVLTRNTEGSPTSFGPEETKRLSIFTGDADSDGQSDNAEYLAGTDQFDPASFLSVSASPATNGERLIRWRSNALRSYYIEACADLRAPLWNMVAGPLAGNGGDLAYALTNEVAGESQYFRLLVRHPAP